MKKNTLLNFVVLVMVVSALSLNIKNSKSELKELSINLINLKTAFAQQENPEELYLRTLTTYPGYCVDCWEDPLGEYQVSCTCTRFEFRCENFEEGDSDCTEDSYWEISNNCVPTGEDC